MPDLANRPRYESELTDRLSGVLADHASVRPNIDSLEMGIKRALEPTLEDVAATAILLVMMQEDFTPPRDPATVVRPWADRQASAIALLVADDTERRLAGAENLQGSERERILDTAFGRTRAESIAITEVTRANSVGERMAVDMINTGERAGSAGTDSQRPKLVAVWQTERDAKVCRICRPLDRLDEAAWINKFPSGPPAHPRCRCFVIYRPLRA